VLCFSEYEPENWMRTISRTEASEQGRISHTLGFDFSGELQNLNQNASVSVARISQDKDCCMLDIAELYCPTPVQYSRAMWESSVAESDDSGSRP
jgi:hypothetical protein